VRRGCWLSGRVRGGLAEPAEEKSPFAAADAQIVSEIREHSDAAANLEYLSDSIGARLTGSPQLKQANDWTREMFAKYGAIDAHLEGWTMERSWARGTASARMVSPGGAPADDCRGGMVAEYAWSGDRGGGVLRCEGEKRFCKVSREAEGARLLFTRSPASLSPPKPDDPNALLSRPMQQPPARIGEPPVEDPYEAFMKAARERAEFWKQGRRSGGAARFEQAARFAEHDGREPGALRHRADSYGVHHRRGVSDDFPHGAASFASAR